MANSQQGKSLGTVLVVGGCGFLGSQLVNQLLNFPSEDQLHSNGVAHAKESGQTSSSQNIFDFPTLRSRYPSYSTSGTRVHAIDLKCTRNMFPGCTYYDADITNPEKLMEVFSKVKPDVVINTASPAWNLPKPVLQKVNIEGTRTLLEVAGGKYGNWGGRCRAFVHTSSSSVIHDAVSDLINADERYPLVLHNKREPYSATKAVAEKLVLAANDKEELGHMLVCAVRPAGIVGEGDMSGWTYGVLKTASDAPTWQLHLQLGANDNNFELTYVGNVAYGLLCAADALLETAKRKDQGKTTVLDYEKVDGEAFIVTNDQPLPFWDAARFVWTAYGREINGDRVRALPEYVCSALGLLSETAGWMSGRPSKLTRQSVKYSCMHRSFSCRKIADRCGYEPVISIEEGLLRAVKRYKEDEAQELEKMALEKKAQ